MNNSSAKALEDKRAVLHRQMMLERLLELSR